jgi:hypothetical protein
MNAWVSYFAFQELIPTNIGVDSTFLIPCMFQTVSKKNKLMI